MLEELLRSRLEVKKVPAKPGYSNSHVKLAVNQNAEWYRAFCKKYMGPRRKKRWMRIRTIIRRLHTTDGLKRIIKHGSKRYYRCGLYRERLLEAIEEYSVEFERQYGIKVA